MNGYTIYLQNTYLKRFKLGSLYLIRGQMYRFIHVTPKGFNFLNMESYRCLCRKRHLYDKRFVGKAIPMTQTLFECRISNWLNPVEVPMEKVS